MFNEGELSDSRSDFEENKDDKMNYDSMDSEKEKWKSEVLHPFLKKAKERKEKFSSLSDIEIERLYSDYTQGFDYNTQLGYPGEYPFTRGPYPTMYRGRLWTMRQFAGFGSAKDTNLRFKYLLEKGQTGLSVAFHYPSLYGRDSDHPLSAGEVGKVGVAIDSLEDMEELFEGIPLDKVSTSMTINGSAPVMLAIYYAAAKKQGVNDEDIRGTIQNDALKEYIAQNTYIFPPEGALRLIVDTFEFCSKKMPNFNPISISGYHIREAGANATQELAFTLRNGLEYIQRGVDRGLDVDSFAPRLSFFFDVHSDFFEEIAKLRAARRIWAKEVKKRFSPKNEHSLRLRMHCQTAGVTLAAQDPMNNIIRVTIQALAGVLGGTQSLHTNSYDEALALPTKEAVTLSLRTQQIIAHESGVTSVVDPLGGSFFVEQLTDRMEESVYKIWEEIEEIGGVVPAIRDGYFLKEIARSSFKQQEDIESKERIVVGVNSLQNSEDQENIVPILKIDADMEERQKQRLQNLRKTRDNTRVEEALQNLSEAAKNTQENLMPFIYECVIAYATLGEICDILRDVFGEWKDLAVM